MPPIDRPGVRVTSVSRAMHVLEAFAGHPEGVALSDAAGSGMWSVDVPLTPGVHHYVFIIDGREWLPDPNASQVDDGFGEKNSVVLVPPRAES